MGTCNFCGNNAGFLRSRHGECAAAHEAGLADMARLVREAATRQDPSEDELRTSLNTIASRSFAGEPEVNASIAEGWKLAVEGALSDGIPSRDEESRLRGFHERFVMVQDPDTTAAVAKLDKASYDRLALAARHAALAESNGESTLQELARLLDESELSPYEERRLLAHSWETAVSDALDDDVLSLDEETALASYLSHFNLSANDVNSSEGHTRMVKAVVIREASEGLVPQRLKVKGRVPFNLMKSEQLVWMINDVKYLEVLTRRQRRGASHGVSVRIAKGVYYSPRTFSSQTHEWEETVHVDTGILGVTTKHLYFHGARKRFRVRYDRVVSFEPYRDGMGIMRDAQSAKPQAFITGDGWFIYNLVTNLAQQ